MTLAPRLDESNDILSSLSPKRNVFMLKKQIAVLIIIITKQRMLVNRILRYAFSNKEEYSRFFVLRLRFNQDGYYESSQHRQDFVASLKKLQKNSQAIVLGGDSFPFGCTTFYINCDEEQTATRFAKENIFSQKGIATAELSQIERVSTPKFGNVANFYDMKVDV